VWKVLLGVVSVYRDSWQTFEEERNIVFRELRRTVGYLYPSNGDKLEVLLFKMFVALNGGLPEVDIANQHLVSIAKAMLGICDGRTEEAFWLYCGFLRGQANEKMSVAMRLSRPTFQQIICGTNPAISSWMSETIRIIAEANIKRNLVALEPLCLPWFQSNFSSILPTHCLERIWDIQLGASALGSTVTVPPFIAAALIMAVDADSFTGDDLTEALIRSKMDADNVTQNGISLWEESVPGHQRFIQTWRGSKDMERTPSNSST
jgi:hypothetical protein